MNEPYEFYEAGADYVRTRMPFAPQIAVILGSSLGPFAERLQNTVEIDYHEVPNFPVSTAPGHAGKLMFGELAGKKLVCLAGRFHSYEGYDFEQLTQPVRLLKLLGVRALIVTNAAGGVNLAYHRGDFMLIADHIKLNGSSPMRGRNVDEFGPRFFDVTRMYTPELRELAKSCAAKLGFSVHEGVYFFMPGPQFETPAEIRAIRLLGDVDCNGGADGGALWSAAAGHFRDHQHGRRHHGRGRLRRGGQRDGRGGRGAVQPLS